MNQPLSRDQLLSTLDRYLAALAANELGELPRSAQARSTENNVVLELGDGAWNTVVDIDRVDITLADPDTRQVAAFGILREGPDWGPFGVRLRLDEQGAVVESEMLVVRPMDIPARSGFSNANLSPRPEFGEPVPVADRASRDELIALADGYFETLEINDGVIRTRIRPDCLRRENGVLTALNPDPNASVGFKMDCNASFALGYYAANDRVRERRFPLVDVEHGIVFASGFIDHSGTRKTLVYTDGQEVPSRYLRPHTLHLLELFKVVDQEIVAIEAIHHAVPYRMPSPWNTEWATATS